MGKALVRLGDTSSHGGSMISSSSWIQCGNQSLCVDGDIHHCPLPGHNNTPVTATSRITARGKRMLRVGDVAGCGAIITQGDPKTNSV